MIFKWNSSSQKKCLPDQDKICRNMMTNVSASDATSECSLSGRPVQGFWRTCTVLSTKVVRDVEFVHTKAVALAVSQSWGAKLQRSTVVSWQVMTSNTELSES